jgi:hypothetical protein
MQPYENAGLGITTVANGQVVALSTFSIDAPGDYTLRTDAIDGIPSRDSRIVVGKSLYAPLAKGAVAALAAIGISAMLSVIATIALAVTRGRAKRARDRPDWGPGPQWPEGPSNWIGPPPIVPPPPPGYGGQG